MSCLGLVIHSFIEAIIERGSDEVGELAAEIFGWRSGRVSLVRRSALPYFQKREMVCLLVLNGDFITERALCGQNRISLGCEHLGHVARSTANIYMHQDDKGRGFFEVER